MARSVPRQPTSSASFLKGSPRRRARRKLTRSITPTAGFVAVAQVHTAIPRAAAIYAAEAAARDLICRSLDRRWVEHSRLKACTFVGSPALAMEKQFVLDNLTLRCGFGGPASRIKNCLAIAVTDPTPRFVSLALIALLVGCTTAQGPNESAPRDGPLTALAARSPFEEPPGALSPAVNQANIATTICVAGWTATVRPPTSYTQSVKRRMLAQVGAPASQVGDYELDHFVPLALGGNPTSLDNLWLQRWLGPWNARIKDRLERTLQVLVCEGKVRLSVARNAIRKGWKAAYAKYVDGVGAPREMEPNDDDEPVE